jgi:hypothetical protein
MTGTFQNIFIVGIVSDWLTDAVEFYYLRTMKHLRVNY